MNPKNSFYVLGLGPDASAADLERAGRKCLGLLAVGAAKGKTYDCPLGAFPRDETMVREAMAALRDPKKRAREALLAHVLAAEPDASALTGLDAPLAEAFLLGEYEGF